MTNPKNRARLPALPPVSAQDASMRAWLQAVTERLEVREGQRGDADERALTQRDLAAFLAESTSPAPSTKGGWWESISNVEDLGEALRNTRMYNDLLRRISNASGEPLVGAMAGKQLRRRPPHRRRTLRQMPCVWSATIWISTA